MLTNFSYIKWFTNLTESKFYLLYLTIISLLFYRTIPCGSRGDWSVLGSSLSAFDVDFIFRTFIEILSIFFWLFLLFSKTKWVSASFNDFY